MMIHYTYKIIRHIGRQTRLKSGLIATIIIFTVLFCTQLCIAESDLDDDISKYKDDPIAKWDELGKKSTNISFIIVEALGRINRPDKNKIINSVIVGPGSNVGDIYNIHLNDQNIPSIPKRASEDK